MERYNEGWDRLGWPHPPRNETGMLDLTDAEKARLRDEREKRERHNRRRRERRIAYLKGN